MNKKSLTNYGQRTLGAICASALLLVCVLLAPFTVSAQSAGQVTGVVIDETEHLPMPGVTVAVMKGDKMVTGTATNLDGEFTLTVPAGTKIRFTYIGYAPQEVTPVTGKPMEIVMQEDKEKLEEVVVNGFFTRKRNTYTGASKSLSGDEILLTLSMGHPNQTLDGNSG